MKEKSKSSEIGKFKKKRVKVIVACTVAMTMVLSSGFSAFAADTSKQGQNSKQVIRSLGKFKIQMKLPVANHVQIVKPVQVVNPKPVENEQSNNNNTEVQKSTNKESTKKQSVEQNKAKKDNTQVKQATTKPITYTSKGLGISFDMPASWANNYFIRDNGVEVSVFMKHKDNSKGIGYLFTITTDITSHDGGKYLDGIGVEKNQTINGRQYLIGGPLDVPMYDNDPKIQTFSAMIRQTASVAKTIRAAK